MNPDPNPSPVIGATGSSKSKDQSSREAPELQGQRRCCWCMGSVLFRFDLLKGQEPGRVRAGSPHHRLTGVRGEEAAGGYWIARVAWLPAVAVCVLLVWPTLELGWAALGGGVPPGPGVAARGHRGWVRLLDLFMLSGMGFLLAWFIGLYAVSRRWGSGSDRQRVGTAAVATLLGGGMWAGVLLTFLGGEQTLGLVLFIYLPTLVVTFGLFGLAVPRIRRSWAVVGTALLLGGLCLGMQLACLGPGKGEPSEAIFVVGALPMGGGLAVWLATLNRAVDVRWLRPCNE